MIRLIAVAAAALFGLGACQTLQDEVGDGPIKLSHGVAQALEAYLVDNRSIGMAVSIDGRHLSWYYCDHSTAIGCLMSNAKIVYRCEQRSNGVPCRMFAKYTQLTWQNPGSFMPFKSEAVKDVLGDYYYDGKSYGAGVTQTAVSRTGADERKIFGSWEGVNDKLDGFLRISTPTKTEGKMRVRMKDGSISCYGNWTYLEGKFHTAHTPRGEWQAKCNNGESLTGTYVYDAPAVGTVAGTDGKGRKVELFF